MSQKVSIKGIFEPKRGYLGTERWMEGNFVPIRIVEGYLSPFYILYRSRFSKNLHKNNMIFLTL